MKVLFMRKNHVISDINGKTIFTGFFETTRYGKRPSINAAKRKSRELQELHGMGSLRVVS